jgi:hypothetical protein
MRSRRSISDIVAVVLLIVIAIAAAVIIYMWLSGLIGSMHTSTSATQVKLEITGASVTPASGGGYNVIAYVYNPPGSPTVSIATAELEFTNGTLICSTPLTTVTITTTSASGSGSSATTTVVTTSATAIPPGIPANVTFTCKTSSSVTLPTLPTGTPVEIVLITPEGVQVTYTATVS